MRYKKGLFIVLCIILLNSFLHGNESDLYANSEVENNLNLQGESIDKEQNQSTVLALDVSETDEIQEEEKMMENVQQKTNTSDAEEELAVSIQTPVREASPLSNDIQTFDLSGIIGMSKAFDISGFSTQIGNSGLVHERDIDQFITIEGNTIAAGNNEYANSTKRYYQTMHLKSKFKVDFTRSFEIAGTGKTPSANPDGITFGFYNDDNFSLSNGFNNTGAGMGVYSVYSTSLQDSVHNAIVYEIDTYNNHGQSGYAHLKDNAFTGRHAALITVDEGGSLTAHTGNTIQDKYLTQEQPYIIRYDKNTDVLEIAWTEDTSYRYSLSNPKQYLKSDHANFYMSGVINQMEQYGVGGALHLSFIEFKYTDVEYQADTSILIKRGSENVKYIEDDVTTYPKPGEEIKVAYAIHNKINDTSSKQTPIRFSKVLIGDTPVVPYDIKAYDENGDEVALDDKNIFNGDKLDNGLYNTTMVHIPENSKIINVQYKLKLDEHHQENTSIINEIYLGAEGMTQYDFTTTTKALGLPTLKSNQSQYTSISTESSLMTNEEILKDIVGHVYDHQESMAIDTFMHGDFFCKLEDMNGNIITQIDKGQYGVYKQSCTLSDQRYDLTSPEMIRHIYVSDIYQESDSIQISAHGVSVAMTELKQHGNDLEAWIKQKTDVVATIKGERMDIATIQVNLQDFHVDASYDNSPYIIKFQADDMEHGTSTIIEVPIEVVSGIDLTVENIIINQAELQAHESDLSTYLLQLANVTVSNQGKPLNDYQLEFDLKGFNAFVEASETPYELEVIVTTQSTQITEKATLMVSVTPNVYSYLSIPSRIELFDDQGYVNGTKDDRYAGALGRIHYQGNVDVKQVKILAPASIVLYPDEDIKDDIYIVTLYDSSGYSLPVQEANKVELLNKSDIKEFNMKFRLNTKRTQDHRQVHYTGILSFQIELLTR